MLQTASVSLDQYEQRILARSIVNSIIDEFCGLSPEWAFLVRPGEILTEADETEYACPKDFARVVPGSIKIGSTPITLVYPSDENRWNQSDNLTSDTYTQSSYNRVVATIATLTQTPYGRQGTVFPIDGSSAIAGYGTAFESEMVGRFFATARDGELYRIRSVQNQKELTLDQPFRGGTQRGKVKVYSSNAKMVHGAPFLTRFDLEMIGRYITISGDADARIIDSVDPIEQTLTVTTDITVTGTDLQYSIEDDYQIDPKGSWIISFKNYDCEDDEVIAFKYYSNPEVAMDWYEQLPLPVQYHNIIEAGSIAEFLSSTGRNVRAISRYDKRYEIGKLRAVNTEDPLNNAGRTIPLGDIT